MIFTLIFQIVIQVNRIILKIFLIFLMIIRAKLLDFSKSQNKKITQNFFK